MKSNIHASRDNCNGHEFAVKFLDTGGFPDDGPVDDIVRKPHLAIIAANNIIDGKWSFANLSAEEKHCIGDKMLDFKCEINIWYWCELFS